jgi:hypothetical protein
MGVNPFREKRTLSAEQKAALAERLAKGPIMTDENPAMAPSSESPFAALEALKNQEPQTLESEIPGMVGMAPEPPQSFEDG